MSAPSSAIESVLVENRVFPPSYAVVKAARVSGMAGYEASLDYARQRPQGRPVGVGGSGTNVTDGVRRCVSRGNTLRNPQAIASRPPETAVIARPLPPSVTYGDRPARSGQMSPGSATA